MEKKGPSVGILRGILGRKNCSVSLGGSDSLLNSLTGGENTKNMLLDESPP